MICSLKPKTLQPLLFMDKYTDIALKACSVFPQGYVEKKKSPILLRVSLDSSYGTLLKTLPALRFCICKYLPIVVIL